MTNEDFFNFYDENWNDYSKVVDMMHVVMDQRDDEINTLKHLLQNGSPVEKSDMKEETYLEKIKGLESMLQDCQDKLDEETHKSLDA